MNILKFTLCMSLAVVLSACGSSHHAADDGLTFLNARDQVVEVKIITKEDGICDIHVDPKFTDICPSVNDKSYDNPCGNDPECICTNPGKWVKWKRTADSAPYEFALIPKVDSEFPFTKKCNIYSNGNGEVECKIKRRSTGPGFESFSYNVMVAGCKNVYDPRIVIGR